MRSEVILVEIRADTRYGARSQQPTPPEFVEFESEAGQYHHYGRRPGEAAGFWTGEMDRAGGAGGEVAAQQHMHPTTQQIRPPPTGKHLHSRHTLSSSARKAS